MAQLLLSKQYQWHVDPRIKWYCYKLKSKEGFTYVGVTHVLGHRLNSHKSGKCKTTAKGSDWKLIECLQFSDSLGAFRVENFYHQGATPFDTPMGKAISLSKAAEPTEFMRKIQHDRDILFPTHKLNVG